MWAIRSFWTVFAAAIKAVVVRLVRGPRRPGWTWKFEIAIAGIRAHLNQAATYPNIFDQRRLQSALASYPPAALSHVHSEPVDAGGVPAWWITPRNDAGEAIVYYLHGGGYVFQPNLPDGLAAHVSLVSRSKTLTLGYRLAPEYPYPAALEDAFAGYQFLLEQGISPSRLAIAGDSAGGGLALALLLSLREARVRMPALALLLSPWVDLECKGASMTGNEPYDYINQRALLQWAAWYAAGADPRDPLLSPINARLDGLPPLYIQAGGAEILIDQIKAFDLQAKADGARVQLDIWRNMPHDFQAFGALAGESRQAFDKLGEVFRHYIPSGPA